jgi:alkyldihydroxyacetonephosphate synthase
MTGAYKNRKYWGWGSTGIEYPRDRLNKTLSLLNTALGIITGDALSPADPEEIKLAPPRFELPGNLAEICTADNFQRLLHTYGMSFRDVWRALHGRFDHPPDYVAFPQDESHLIELFRFAETANVGLVIYGGGTSVVGGVEMPSGSSKAGFISVDLSKMDKVININEEDMTVRVQAGCFGPALERQLKEKGMVLRHYPQSFEFSSVGGWVATRAGGHYATVFTQIDHFVQQLRLVTPTGIVTTRKLPNSGAGPNENRYFCGSEGAFGIISEVTLKVQRIPKHKRSMTVTFNSFEDGVEACRQLSQSQLYPTNARLVDNYEALANGLGDGMSTVLILGYESPAAPVDSLMEAALDICSACGGNFERQGASLEISRDKKADEWKRSFLLAPYLRDELIRRGLIVETFETCTTWSNFQAFHKKIKQTVMHAISEYCGSGMITCRFTHIYPDGPAPYYTVIAKGKEGLQFDQWNAIKEAASRIIVENGGTITHHHAVGRDHRPYYEMEQDPEYLNLLRKMKDHFDPDGLLNEGVLIN